MSHLNAYHGRETVAKAMESLVAMRRGVDGLLPPPPPPCPTCKGSGRVKEPVETYSYSEYDMCPKCKAKGTVKQ